MICNIQDTIFDHTSPVQPGEKRVCVPLPGLVGCVRAVTTPSGMGLCQICVCRYGVWLALSSFRFSAIDDGPPVCGLVGGAAALNVCRIRPFSLSASHSRPDPAAHLLPFVLFVCIQHTQHTYTAMHLHSPLIPHITDAYCCISLALVSVGYFC